MFALTLEKAWVKGTIVVRWVYSDWEDFASRRLASQEALLITFFVQALLGYWSHFYKTFTTMLCPGTLSKQK